MLTVFQAGRLWLSPDVWRQGGRVRGRGGDWRRGRRSHGDHPQRVQQGARGQQRGDAETVHEPPDVVATADASSTTLSLH